MSENDAYSPHQEHGQETNGFNYLRFQKHDTMFPNTTILVVIQSTIRTKQDLNKHCVTSVRCSTFLLAVAMFESSRFSSRGGPLSAKTKKRVTRIKIISFDLLNADFRHIYFKSFEFLVPTFISWRSRSSRRRWRKDLLKSWGDGRCHWSGGSRIDLEKIKSLLFFTHITLRLTTMGQTWLSDAVSNLRNRFSFLFSWTI